MTNLRKAFAAGLLALLLGSLAGCIVAERPYPAGENYRYRDPRWRYDRYDRYRDRGRYDYRHRDWDRD
jgi:hypothetical protein